MFSTSHNNRESIEHDPELDRTLRILASLHGNYDNVRTNQQKCPADRSQSLRIDETFQRLAQSTTKNPNSSVVPEEPIYLNSNQIVNLYNEIQQLRKKYNSSLLKKTSKRDSFNVLTSS